VAPFTSTERCTSANEGANRARRQPGSGVGDAVRLACWSVVALKLVFVEAIPIF